MENKFEKVRKKHGIAQGELAPIFEVSRQTTGPLENGKYDSFIPLIFKIARYLNLATEDIFIYQEEGNDKK